MNRKLTEEELKSIKEFINSAYTTDEYVCWAIVRSLEKIIKAYDSEDIQVSVS